MQANLRRDRQGVRKHLRGRRPKIPQPIRAKVAFPPNQNKHAESASVCPRLVQNPISVRAISAREIDRLMSAHARRSSPQGLSDVRLAGTTKTSVLVRK